jgi:7,8-dihydropterin-6-yl-methyl-4-(beta-D-ribofuranosyl)aminobenzene 5'-phosphate synthase
VLFGKFDYLANLIMKITLLCENGVGHDGSEVCLAEWGFSAFVQMEDVNILFDTGHTDIYKKNAKQLGIDLEDTDFIVLSHHHWDHVGGLRFHDFKNKKKLIAHPEVFEKLLQGDSEKFKNDFEIVASEEALEFSKNIFYLGQIPRENDFEANVSEKDAILDDSAIVIKTPKGAIVITGCSHSGICNICEYAKKVSGQNLHAVIGGFHLCADNQEVVNKTIEYFKNENPEHIFPMHCVDFATQVKFHTNFGCKKYSAGDVIEI